MATRDSPALSPLMSRYTLHRNVVRIEYGADTDQPTVVNLTNHTYFNIAGEGSGSILNQRLTLYADNYTPVDTAMVPTGKVVSVAGTPYDFARETTIGEHAAQDDPQLKRIGGFDHNWVLRGLTGTLKPAARLFDPASGRILLVQTTEPAIQFNSGQYFDATLIGRAVWPTESLADWPSRPNTTPTTPNHKNFPSTELHPGEHYHSITTWTLSAH